MKKQLLRIINIFIGINIIFLNKMNMGVSASPTTAYEARQKMISFLDKEKNNEEVKYKYLAEQLCIFFNPPHFPDEELTFNTPFGVARIAIQPTRSVFITNGINKYADIGETLDDILTKNGRKRLAKIILKYLQTTPDVEYRAKAFNKYTFDDSNVFFDLKNKFCFLNLQSNSKSYKKKCKKLKNLINKIEIWKLRAMQEVNLKSIKDKNKREEIKKARTKLNELGSQKNQTQREISNMEKRDKEKLEKAKNAANALCAILMVAEPNYRRSFDGGKHERALMRDIKFSGTKYTDAFKKFSPSRKDGAKLAYKYSTKPDITNEILESDYYSDDEVDIEEDRYDLDNLF